MEQKVQVIPAPTPSAFPVSNILYQSSSCVITDEPTGQVIITQGPQFTLGFFLVLYILWVWTNVQRQVSAIIVSHRAASLP